MLAGIQSRLDELKKIPGITVTGLDPIFEIQIPIQDFTGWFSPIFMSVCAYAVAVLKNSENAIHPLVLWLAPASPILIVYLWMLKDRGTTHHLYFNKDSLAYERRRRNKVVETCKGFVSKVNVHFHNTRGPGGFYKIYLTEELGNYFTLPEEGTPNGSFKALLDLFQELEKQNQTNGTVARPEKPDLSPTNILKLILIGVGIFAAILGGLVLWSKL